MRVDLPFRVAVVTYFCVGALGAELVGGFLGLPVNDGLAATLGTVLVGTFGVGLLTREGTKDGGNGGPEG